MDPQQLWEFLKYKIRQESIKFGAEQKRNNINDIQTLETEMHTLQNNTHMSQYAKDAEMEILNTRLNTLLLHKVKGIQIRSRANQIELEEKSTKFFFKQECINYEKKNIVRLNINGTTIEDPTKILKEAKNYFQNVLSTKNLRNNQEAIQNFMSNNENMSILSQNEMLLLENDLTIEELDTSKTDTNKNKTPGTDGLPIEFYEVFWLKLREILLSSLNYGLRSGTLSFTQREGIITLLPKKDKDTLYIKNWRPLSLLNVDYKLLAKCLANRIKKHIDLLINSDQTGFIKGRFIGENINKILSIIEYCDTHEIEAMIVNIDFEKAYDSIEWDHLDRTLQFFNFGPKFRSWVKTLYNESQSKVLNNGWASDPIYLTRGLRQGCPLSSFLFILVAEILANKIRLNDNIKGVQINNTTHKVCQYADDTEIIILYEETSLRELFSVCENFENISGLKINSDKTEIMRIGKAKNYNSIFLPHYKCKWKVSIRTLGVDLFNDLNLTLSKNYTKKIEVLKKTIYFWSQREVTMYGKILLAKTFLISQFNFLLSCLPSPSRSVISELDKKIMQFIRSFKSPQKISQDILQLDKSKGGLNVTLIKDQAIGLKLAWVVRLISSSDQSWKHLVNDFIPLKNNNFWVCNFNEFDCPAIFACFKNIPYFWKDVIHKWAKYNFKEPIDINSVIKQPLWFNTLIRNHNNALLYYKQAYQSGIFTISDLIIDKHLATYEQIIVKFPNSGLNFLKYYGLIRMIPNEWKQKITQYFYTNSIILTNSIMYNIQSLAMKKRICALITKNRRETFDTFPEIPYTKWQTSLSVSLERNEFLEIFEKMYFLTKDPKLLYFKYKLLHRNIITNRNLRMWDANKPIHEQRSENCTFCNRYPEYIEHFLYDCYVSKTLWNSIFQWVFNCTGLSINFTRTQILLGTAPDELQIFNLIFMIVTKYIHDCKCLDQTPNTYLLKYKIKQYFLAERLIAEQKNKIISFNEKWDCLLNCFD